MNKVKNMTLSKCMRNHFTMKLLIGAALISEAVASNWTITDTRLDDPSLICNDWGTDKSSSQQFGWFKATCTDVGESSPTLDAYELRLPATINVARYPDFSTYFSKCLENTLRTFPFPLTVSDKSINSFTTKSYVDPSYGPSSGSTDSLQLLTIGNEYSIVLNYHRDGDSNKAIPTVASFNYTNVKTENNAYVLRALFSNGTDSTPKNQQAVYYRIRVLPNTTYTPTFTTENDFQTVSYGNALTANFPSTHNEQIGSTTPTYTIVKQPENGKVTTKAGNYTFTPTLKTGETTYFVGSDSFKFKVTEPTHNTSAIGTVTILTKGQEKDKLKICFTDDDSVEKVLVKTVGKAPGTAKITLPTAKYDDDSIASLNYKVTTAPTNGTIGDLDASSGTLTYTSPADPTITSDSLQVNAADATGNQCTKTIYVSINNISANGAVAKCDASTKDTSAINMLEDSIFHGALQAKDTSGHAIKFEADTKPAHGDLRIDPISGEVVYQPFCTYSGSDSFTFKAISKTGTDTSTVKFNIAPRRGPDALIYAIWHPHWGAKHYWNALRAKFY